MEEPSALVLVIDANPAFWAAQRAVGGISFVQCMESLLVFLNAHMLMNRENRLAVVSNFHGATHFLFPTKGQEGLASEFAAVSRQVIAKLEEVASSRTDGATRAGGGGHSTSTALSTALCWVHRMLRQAVNVVPLRPHILVISGSADVSSEYLVLMNAVFSAQKSSVPIDACVLAREDSPFLQQAAFLTNGMYLRPEHQSGLLQYLLTAFLPSPAQRKALRLPHQEDVDLRAVCFCHREPVDIAFVCSVCLSVFCEFSPECSTCGTRARVKRRKVASGSGVAVPSAPAAAGASSASSSS